MRTAKESYEKMSLYEKSAFWCTVYNVANVTKNPNGQKFAHDFVKDLMENEQITIYGILKEIMYVDF